jgi:hypothetical protein
MFVGEIAAPVMFMLSFIGVSCRLPRAALDDEEEVPKEWL